MEDIKVLAQRALIEGLPDKETNLPNIGRSNLPREIELALSQHQSAYKNAIRILYADGNTESGLISGLQVATNGASASLEAAWKCCKEQTKPSLDALSRSLSDAQIPLTSFGLAATLQNPAKDLEVAADALTKARTSLEDLAKHLDKSTATDLSILRSRLCDFESIYDGYINQREVLETDYERRRIEQAGDYRTGGNDWLIRDAHPWRVREIWKYNRGGHYEFDQDNLQVVKDAPTVAYPHQQSVREVWSAQVKGDSVEFPSQGDFDRRLENDEFREPEYGWDWMAGKKVIGKYINNSKHRPFFKIYGRQQAIMKALTEVNPPGPWRFEEDNKANYSGTIYFRDRLDAAMGIFQDISYLAKEYQDDVVEPMIRLTESLTVDMRDLHANLYFGDFEDQLQDLKTVQRSIQKWCSALDSLDKTKYKRIQNIDIRDRFATAYIHEHSKINAEGRSDMAWNRAIRAINHFEIARDRELGILVGKSDETGKAHIWNPRSADIANARMQALELPESRDFQHGEVTTDGRDMQHNRDPHKELDFDFPITFDQEFTTPPSVACWLSGIEITNDEGYRLNALPINITTKGFTLRILTWWTTKLDRVCVSWVAYPSDKAHVTSGRQGFGQRGFHSDADFGPSKYMGFPSGRFTQAPHIFLGISGFDMSKDTHPRFTATKSNVSKEGMKLSAYSRFETDCYWVDVTYLAIGKEAYDK